jgi:hypothetical protein
VTPSLQERLAIAQTGSPEREGFDTAHVLRETSALSGGPAGEQETIIEEQSAESASALTDEGSDGGSSAVAAEEPADAADNEAGEPEVAADQSTAPAPVSLSDSDKAFLIRVFKTMKAAVGPDTNVFKRQAMVFTDEIGGMSDLVRAKARTIREQLQTCCGETATKGTVEVGRYLAGIIGVDERELAD